ncbi:hypothetical protein CK203_062421 [Vitis vinifera]|uniref:Uncharacterized protein n=1 Tax=Vitis vinifera TaxID=29760 RepID=A0A438FQ19_VITVI|nr:hypothetical protein CK203_062421 [Vitis vinifera]
MANARARKNFLSKVNINGNSLTSAEDIKDGVCRAYRTLLVETEDWRPRMGNLQFRVLGSERARSLEEPFSEKEVFEALYSLSGDKAPEELKFHFSRLNSKKGGCGRAKRLQTNKLEYQHAFIQNRQILDVALIANKAVDSRLKVNIHGLLLKLDIKKLLFRARSGGFIEGFKVGNTNGIERDLLHLLFADDTFLFYKANSGQLHYLSWVFLWFEAISGLKVNRDKSEVIPIGRVDYLENIVSVLGCRIGKLPSSYLGLPLGAHFKSARMWDIVEERFRKRLSLWKRQYLSKWGRVTLIKNTLSSLPIYLMSFLVIPWKVCARLEKIQRDFFFVALNKAPLGKWNWKFAIERNSLWKQVIIEKYEKEEGGWCSKEVRGAYGVGLWKAIRKDWEIIHSRSCFIVGNGRKVKFWKDLWCEDQALKDAFPNLFRLAVNKDQWYVMLGRRKERWVAGILCSQEALMIRKWKRWRACSKKYTLWFCIVMYRML